MTPSIQSPDYTTQLAAEAREYMPGGVNSSTRFLDPPIVWKHAYGSRMVDVDGREYIDYHAAFGPTILGHNHRAVNSRVIEAISAVDMVGVGVTELEVQLAEKLCRHIPSAEKVLLCVTGSEATYNAVRLARAVTGRKKLIKFQGCYHGWHDYLCMNVISPPEKLGQRHLLSSGTLEEAAAQTIVVDYNSLEQVEEALRQNRDSVAAVILEPIPHNIGCVLPEPGFLEGLRELCSGSGALLIFDEVITGFRHSLGGYQRICGVTPDLTTLAKSMANGYPCAALCGKREYMDRFQTNHGDVFFAGTYNGHPTGVAAALATIDELENGTVHESLFRNGEYVASELSGILERAGLRAHVAQYGSVFVPYFMEPPVHSYTDLLRNDTDRDLRFRREMMNRGVFMLPLAMKRNHLSAAHTMDDIGTTLQHAEDVLKSLARS
jgi:glutamate-1-semialdehyde 2,1-aminomutase